MTTPILFFDGQCGLCDATVRFVLEHESDSALRFAPLQSEKARAMLAPLGVDADDLSSVLVLEDGIVHRESEAALRVAARLRSPWRWLALMKVIPRPVRDAIYRQIGRRRYEWWGRVSAHACVLRDESIGRRFL